MEIILWLDESVD